MAASEDDERADRGGPLPNFFIVGAAKAGTTFLYRALQAQTRVFMPARKEPNFFTHDDLGAQGLYYGLTPVSTWQDYGSLFTEAGEAKAIGEASVSYLFYPGTAARIHAAFPNARILIMLRDPVERAFSHYLMDRRLGYVRHPFADLVRREALPTGADVYYQQYVEVGLYHEQVKRYLDTFGCKRVKVMLFDDIYDSRSLLAGVYRFLELDPEFELGGHAPANAHISARAPLVASLYAMPRVRRAVRYLASEPVRATLKRVLFRRAPKPILDGFSRQCLCAFYRDNVAELQDLIGRDLSAWCQIEPVR